MEVKVLSNHRLVSKNHPFYKIDFGDVQVGEKVEIVVSVKGINIVKNRTTCQCTIADIEKTEEEYIIKIGYKTDHAKLANQKVTLVTDEAYEIYLSIIGAVIKKEGNE